MGDCFKFCGLLRKPELYLQRIFLCTYLFFIQERPVSKMQTNLSIAPEHLSETIQMMDLNQGRAQALCPIFGTPSRHNFTSFENCFPEKDVWPNSIIVKGQLISKCPYEKNSFIQNTNENISEFLPRNFL